MTTSSLLNQIKLVRRIKGGIWFKINGMGWITIDCYNKKFINKEKPFIKSINIF